MPKNKPLYYKAPPAPPKPTPPPTPKPNPKDPFNGKEIWKEATMNGDEVFEELFRRLQLALGETLVQYFDELEADDDEALMEKKKLCVSPDESDTDEDIDKEFEQLLKNSKLTYRGKMRLRQIFKESGMRNGSTSHSR